jgi:sugar O-acyltransferase (sialic acid O-acetyltransferase NeuD family)
VSETLYVIGTGGHAKVIASVALQRGLKPIFISQFQYENLNGESIHESYFLKFPPNGDNWSIICGIGSVGQMITREDLIRKYGKLNDRFTKLISSSAIVDSSVKIEAGVFIGPGAIINNQSKVEKHCIINSGAIVEHDCVIGENSHIASGARVLGGVNLGKNVFVGSGAVIRQGLQIASGVTIGASSFCNLSIHGANETWVGVPIKRLH